MLSQLPAAILRKPVPGYTRHQLKHDRLTDATQGTVSWAFAHQRKLMLLGLLLLAVLAAGIGGWYYIERQDDLASAILGRGVRIYQTQLRAPNTPEQPDLPSFASAAERAQAAQKEFQSVVDSYPYTRSADIARYFLGLTALDAGDPATAERRLKEVAEARNQDLAGMAKLALASLYHATNRDPQALAIYNQLIEKPAPSVSKPMAQLQKAAVLERSDPAQAKQLYEQVQKDDPTGPAGQIAQMRLRGK